jgi:hypothetical protein
MLLKRITVNTPSAQSIPPTFFQAVIAVLAWLAAEACASRQQVVGGDPRSKGRAAWLSLLAAVLGRSAEDAARAVTRDRAEHWEQRSVSSSLILRFVAFLSSVAPTLLLRPGEDGDAGFARSSPLGRGSANASHPRARRGRLRVPGVRRARARGRCRTTSGRLRHVSYRGCGLKQRRSAEPVTARAAAPRLNDRDQLRVICQVKAPTLPGMSSPCVGSARQRRRLRSLCECVGGWYLTSTLTPYEKRFDRPVG